MKRLLASLLVLASAAALAGVPAAPPVTPPEQARADDRPVLDVVFALDTTGSMGGLLEGAKQKVWSIASRMASGQPSPRVRVGLVAYRDQGDVYVTQVYPLSDDLDQVYKNLRTFQANGGGDGPEAVQDALAAAVDRMAWSQSPRAARMIFLVGDAPAHDQDKARLLEASRRAIKQGIVVNTIRCGGDGVAEQQFREVARLADGRFDTIEQNGGVVAAVTPYDDRLSRLNGALMDTAIYAGPRTAQARGESRRLEAKAMAAPAAADRVSFLAKGGGSASGASAVGALDLASAPERAATLSEDELPAPLQHLKPAERVALAREQQANRARLEAEIATVSKERDGYLATHASDKKDSFDGRVFEAVKATAAKAGVKY
jgi:Mg-chelatase subunit ChlD